MFSWMRLVVSPSKSVSPVGNWIGRFASIDYSKYPTLKEEELEESFVRGSGPGGQAVNKTSNCVILRHIPTNFIVKCHLHRSCSQNRQQARKSMLEKLDLYYNKEFSVQAQKNRISAKKFATKRRRHEKIQELKQKMKTNLTEEEEKPS